MRVSKTRPARGDLCLTSDVGKKTRPARGGRISHPVMWAKNKTRYGGHISHPVTWAKKQDPLGGTYVSPRDVGKKTRPTRGDLCLTQRCGQKTRPTRRGSMGTNSTLSPSTGLGSWSLLMPLLPIKGAWKLTHVPPPDKKGGAYCCPSLQSPPLLSGDIGAHPMSPR